MRASDSPFGQHQSGPLVWASYATESWATVGPAFEKLIEALRLWKVPSSRNQEMFSTWGDQFALLDGFVIERGEPEHAYEEPIYGCVAAGTLVVQLLCQMGELPMPSWATADGVFDVRHLQSVLAWQLEFKRPLLEQRLPALARCEQLRDLSSVIDLVESEDGATLPPAGATLPREIAADVGLPRDPSDLVEGFEDRMAMAPARGLVRGADECWHRGNAYTACSRIGERRSPVEDRVFGEVADDLCSDCFEVVIQFLRDLDTFRCRDGATRTIASVAGGSAHGSTHLFGALIGYSARPWTKVAEAYSVTNGLMSFARDGTVLQRAVIPAYVANAVERAIDGYAAAGIALGYRIE